jgi:uncharacterized membrane protein YccC
MSIDRIVAPERGSARRSPPPSFRSLHPRLLKYLFGQHILNGLAVATGVGVVTALMSACFGFTAAMVAGSGAICVSIGDQPNPLTVKAKTLPLAWILATLASLAAAINVHLPWLEGATVVVFGFVAGMLLGWGRWAIPLSILTMLSIVFTLGAPIADLAEAWQYEILFAAGGGGYLIVALAVTRLLDASGRRLAVGECLREFAGYLRAVAGFYDQDADPATVYVRVVEQQAALSDHLQTARTLVFCGRRSPVVLRLAAALIVLLDSLDAIVSSNADHAPSRLLAQHSPVAPRIAALARLLASDLERLALDLLAGQDHLSLPDRQVALAAIAEEAARLDESGEIDRRTLRATRMTRSRFAWVAAHLARLPAVLASDEAAEAILEDVDLDAFVQPQSLSLRTLGRNLRFSAPVFRHALRLGLSLGTGYALIALVPDLRHGNWILLTIAVILRASYSVTRQRRNDRLIGTAIGCAITGTLLWAAPAPVLLAAMLLAVGTAHAFGRVQYRVTSTAAAVMAILSLHFLDPVEAPPVLARLLDTVIGTAIAYLFSLILPRWEHQDGPQLVSGLLRSTARYADSCLQWNVPQQSYRLARKNLIESLSALSESAARMKGEPAVVRAMWPHYGRLLAASYTTAAQIVTIRLLIRNRLAELDPLACQHLLDDTRQATTTILDPAIPLPPADGGADHIADAGAETYEVLVLRCAEVRHAAIELRRLADEKWVVT